MKKQIQGTSEHNKAMSAAKTDEEKSSVVLHAKAPSFIGDKSVSLSWKEATKTLASTTTGLLRKHLKESHTVVVEAVKEAMAEDRENAVVVVVAVAVEEATDWILRPTQSPRRRRCCGLKRWTLGVVSIVIPMTVLAKTLP
ncbi:unnamed protein product [Brassica oleracea]